MRRINIIVKQRQAIAGRRAAQPTRSDLVERLARGLVLLSLLFIGQAYAETIPSTATETQVTDEQYQYQANVEEWPGYANFATKREAAQAELDYMKAGAPCFWGTGELTGLYRDSYSGSWEAYVEGNHGYCSGDSNYQGEPYATWLLLGRMPGCHPTTTWNGSGCVLTTYSCPAEGNWILSDDHQTCSRCPDPSQHLSQDSACVGVEDKTLGKQGCQERQPLPWDE